MKISSTYIIGPIIMKQKLNNINDCDYSLSPDETRDRRGVNEKRSRMSLSVYNAFAR